MASAVTEATSGNSAYFDGEASGRSNSLCGISTCRTMVTGCKKGIPSLTLPCAADITIFFHIRILYTYWHTIAWSSYSRKSFDHSSRRDKLFESIRSVEIVSSGLNKPSACSLHTTASLAYRRSKSLNSYHEAKRSVRCQPAVGLSGPETLLLYVAISHIVSCVEMPVVRNTAKQRVFMYDTHVKGGSLLTLMRGFWNIAVHNWKTLHITINKEMHERLLGVGGRIINSECSLNRNWMKWHLAWTLFLEILQTPWRGEWGF